MANRYWVGGTADWDNVAGTKWSATSGGAGGVSAPTTADDVFFTNLSTGVCTITTNIDIKSLNCTGFAGTLTGSNALELRVANNVTLASTQTYTFAGVLTLTGTGTLTTAGKTLGSVQIDGGVSTTVTLGSALTIGGTDTFRVFAGAFTTSASNFAVTCGGSILIDGAITRTITLNASTVTTGGVWNASSTTNLTFNAGTSTIILNGDASDFYGGGLTYRNVSITNTSNNLHSITGANTFTNLTLTAPAASTVKQIYFADNQTITTFVCSGASAIRRLMLLSGSLGTARTLTVTTWTTISDVDFRDISMNSARSGTRLGNCGGNTNITFPAAKTVFWNLSGTQNWASTGWATTSGGTPAVNNFPLAQDTATFNNTGALGSVTTVGVIWNIGSVDMSGRTTAGTVTLSGSSIYGNLTYGTGIAASGTSFLTFVGRNTTQTITSAGIGLLDRIIITAIGGTVQLADALSVTGSSGTISLSNGTFNTQNFNVTINGSTSGISVSGSQTKTLTLGSSLVTVAGSNGLSVNNTNTTITANTATITFTASNSKTFSGGGANFNGLTVNQGGSGTLTFTGSNTIGNITNTYSSTGATSILFTAGTTNTFLNWNANGASGRLLTIGSPTAASHTLSKASGVVNANFLSISRSNATGGATWNAFSSVNGGNNTGWIFASLSSGNFIAFFM